MGTGFADETAMQSALEAVIFDLDGVLTRTAELHAAAWKEVFDQLLHCQAKARGMPFVPFDADSDYLTYVDGRSRTDGARNFLDARGIGLPEEAHPDASGLASIEAIAERKDALFTDTLRRDGARVYGSTLQLIQALRREAVRTGIVTSSRNGREVLRRAGVEALFDARVDGIDIDARGLKGKPDPDAFLECAAALGAAPARTVLVEDATVGVEAGRRGGFGLVIGVDRGGNREALAASGAHMVVEDLRELDLPLLRARMRDRQRVMSWRILQEGFDPGREGDMESLFTIGNGYLGVRGALDTPLPGALDDMFVAGIYDRAQPLLPYPEPQLLTEGDRPHEELVSLPFPFRVGLTIGGVSQESGTGLRSTHCRTLDMQSGILASELHFELDGSRNALSTRRFASLVDLHLLLQEVTVELENHSAMVELDATLAPRDVARRFPHLEPLDELPRNAAFEVLHFQTKAAREEVVIAARTTLRGSGTDNLRWRVPGAIGTRLVFQRFVVVYTSRDASHPTEAALTHLLALEWSEFDSYAALHCARWRQFWQGADIRIADQPQVEQALRFNAYHLRSAADHDPRVSIGARTLSGRGYQGHVFWDVEMFMLPFFLHTQPDIARQLLLYRYHTLEGARQRARELGFRGACYAWESTVTGEDVTPRAVRLKTTGQQVPIYTGSQQIHITADVAHAVCRYREATGDDEFLRDFGVEMLAETARFWASRCTREGDSYHLRGVMGPDEYHWDVSDNAYTNRLARFNLEQAALATDWLRHHGSRQWQQLSERIALGPEEPRDWRLIAGALYRPSPRSDCLIEQFAGFFDLDPYLQPDGKPAQPPANKLLDAQRINGLQLLKQADVLMLLYLFPEEFPPEVVLANYRYY
ncbi:MAG: HAD-IA family hydrolase, partial [Acetobacteraceae bacterium]